METPSSTALVKATGTQVLSLTTAFLPPSNRECEINDLTIIPTEGWVSSNRSTIAKTIIYSDPADDRFASCQPLGWNTVLPKSRFTFSPAVCPSQWVAWDIAVSTSVGKKVTTAFCCGSPYSFVRQAQITTLGDEVWLCQREFHEGHNITIQATLSHGKGDEQPISSGVLMHPAWNIIWESSDQATMTPRPPNVKDGTHVYAWVPGTVYDDSHSGNVDDSNLKGLGQSLFWFCVIGLPLIVLTCVGGGIWCCCAKGKKRRLAVAN